MNTAYYFGCWSKRQIGHYLFSTKGQMKSKEPELPASLQWYKLDVPPKGVRQSQIVYSKLDGYSIISMIDNSADTRPDSHAKFFMKGDYSSEELVASFRRFFPEQAARIEACRPFYF